MFILQQNRVVFFRLGMQINRPLADEGEKILIIPFLDILDAFSSYWCCTTK